jgi:hypothetical protein
MCVKVVGYLGEGGGGSEGSGVVDWVGGGGGGGRGEGMLSVSLRDGEDVSALGCWSRTLSHDL